MIAELVIAHPLSEAEWQTLAGNLHFIADSVDAGKYRATDSFVIHAEEIVDPA